MILFSRPPRWKRSAGDVWPPSAAAATVHRTTPEGGKGRAAAAEDGSSSGAYALRRLRKATPQGRQMCHHSMNPHCTDKFRGTTFTVLGVGLGVSGTVTNTKVINFKKIKRVIRVFSIN